MPKKSKPKQRTNWKQRALHCEEVLDINASLANIGAKKLDDEMYRCELLRKCVEEYKARAESAESYVETLRERIDNPLPNPPTHWQRFKSWFAEYGYELLGGAFVLAVLAGLGALLYWNR